MYNRLNDIFRNIKRRCYNPNNKYFKNYGGRGIKLCKEWANSEIISLGIRGRFSKGWLAFQEWALSNGYTDELTIDRIDNNKGYSPDNCRWISRKAQQNNKRNNLYVTYKGKKQTLAQWCEELHLNYNTAYYRLSVMHLSVEEAFNRPLRTSL
jgi:hypothetical protein